MITFETESLCNSYLSGGLTWPIWTTEQRFYWPILALFLHRKGFQVPRNKSSMRFICRTLCHKVQYFAYFLHLDLLQNCCLAFWITNAWLTSKHLWKFGFVNRKFQPEFACRVHGKVAALYDAILQNTLLLPNSWAPKRHIGDLSAEWAKPTETHCGCT